jgi:hypothetical protein
MHDFVAELSRHPLFRLIGALIVMLLTDINIGAGGVAAVLWIGWIWWGAQSKGRPIF